MEKLAEASHVLLRAGRLLLANGAETDEVQRLVGALAANLGFTDVRCAVTSEYLLLTLCDEGGFRTRIGSHIAGLGVNMTVVTGLYGLAEERDLGRLDAALEALERSPAWPAWLVVLTVGLTAASLGRLFGADWPAFAACWLAGSVGMALRLGLARRHANPYLVPFAAALLSGAIGAAMPTSTREIAMVAPAMVIVPGVPLVNAVLDLVKNHTTLGMGRLAQGALTVLAISLGLTLVTRLGGVPIPLNMAMPAPDFGEVVLFAALTGFGYVSLFNVPRQAMWGCLICACLSFSTRVALLQAGVALVPATLAAALLVGFLSQGLARLHRAPPAVFAYPGVVAMVPGAFAFRVNFGLLEWGRLGPAMPAGDMAATGSLAVLSLLVTGAIALGLALPVLLRFSASAGRA